MRVTGEASSGFVPTHVGDSESARAKIVSSGAVAIISSIVCDNTSVSAQEYYPQSKMSNFQYVNDVLKPIQEFSIWIFSGSYVTPWQTSRNKSHES